MIINDLFKNKIVTNQQDVAEGSLNELSSDLLQRSAQVAKNKSNQAMDPKIHDALGGGYMNPLAKHYDSLSQKFSNKAMKLGQRDAVKKIASPAVMRKIGMAEGVEYSPVTQAITRRILRQRTDLLAKYGPEKVGNAIDEVADFVGDVEEIGSSDVSGWVRHVEQILGDMQGVAEGSDAAKYYIVNHDTNENIDGPFDTREEAETVYDRMIKRVESGTMEKNFKIQKKKGVAEAIVGKPRYSEPHQSGRGLYSAADYMVRTKHQLGSHAYTAVTQVDADNDRYYFIYQKGNKEPVFYATDMGRFEVRTDKLGNRISNAIITAHREATDHGLEKYISGDDESEWDQEKNMAEGRPNAGRYTGDKTVRVVRRGGKPIGEIGIDAEASPGQGQYYVKLYDGSVDLSGYDTAEEALDDLKSALN